MGLGDFFSSLFGSGDEEDAEPAERTMTEEEPGGAGIGDAGEQTDEPDRGGGPGRESGGDDSRPDLG